jgi:hypothetical protein
MYPINAMFVSDAEIVLIVLKKTNRTSGIGTDNVCRFFSAKIIKKRAVEKINLSVKPKYIEYSDIHGSIPCGTIVIIQSLIPFSNDTVARRRRKSVLEIDCFNKKNINTP